MRSRRPWPLLALAVAAFGTASCSPAAPKPKQDFTKPAGPAHVERTIQLPGNGGSVHVIAIPGEFSEVTRCIVAVSSVGMIATSCSPKQLEFTATDGQ